MTIHLHNYLVRIAVEVKCLATLKYFALVFGKMMQCQASADTHS